MQGAQSRVGEAAAGGVIAPKAVPQIVQFDLSTTAL